MTVDEALKTRARIDLSLHSTTPRLDAEVLLGHLLGDRWRAMLARPTHC